MSLNTLAKVLWPPGTGLQTTRTGKLITSADSSFHTQITNLCGKSADWGQAETRSPDLHWASSLLWHIAELAHFPLYAGWPVKHLLMAPIWASLFLHTLPHAIGLGEHHLTGHFPHCRFRFSLSPFEAGTWLVPDQSDSLLTFGAIPSRYYGTSCQLKPLLLSRSSCYVLVLLTFHIEIFFIFYLQFDLVRGGPSFQT